MTDSNPATGSCLCGAVTVTARNMSHDVGACHCNMCRKWTGGPFLAVDCGLNVDFGGETNISIFKSSAWAERGFCSKCGTNLYYKLTESGQYIMSTGIFDQETGLNFDHQVFIEEKPAYYQFANETKNMTGEEVFALFAGDSE